MARRQPRLRVARSARIQSRRIGRALRALAAADRQRSTGPGRIADYTNGFRFYSPAAVELLLSHPQRYKGYIYLSETLSLLLKAGLPSASFPILFRNRERGVSNTTFAEVRGALGGIFAIAWSHRFGRP